MMQRSTLIGLAVVVVLAFIVGTTGPKDDDQGTANQEKRSQQSAAAPSTQPRAHPGVSRSALSAPPQASSSPSSRRSSSLPPAVSSPTRTAQPLLAEKRTASATYVMPNFQGKELQQSQDRLMEIGAYLFAQRDATSAGRYQVWDRNWKVCRTDPPAGRNVSIDTRVYLYSVKYDEQCP